MVPIVLINLGNDTWGNICELTSHFGVHVLSLLFPIRNGLTHHYVYNRVLTSP